MHLHVNVPLSEEKQGNVYVQVHGLFLDLIYPHKNAKSQKKLSAAQLLAPYRGVAKDLPKDLSSNRQHMEGYGRR